MTLRTLVLTISGILTPTLEDLLFDAVAAHGGDTESPPFRQYLRKACMDYRLAGSSANDLHDQIIRQAGLDINRERLGEYLAEKFRYDGNVIEILEKLKDRFEINLFSEFSRPLVEGLRRMDGRATDNDRFRLIHIEDLQPEHSLSSLLDEVFASLDMPRDQILFIDRRNQLTTHAVRTGVNAILYVNPFRLEQELTLRKLIQ